jgi:protein-disulfide isomerase
VHHVDPSRQKEYLSVLLWAGIGSVLYSAFLFYISKTELKFVCLWCIRLYGVNTGILVFSLLGGAKEYWKDFSALMRSIMVFIGAFIVSIGGQQLYRSSMLGDAGAIDLDKKIEANNNAIDPHSTEEYFTDPTGAPPALSFSIETEDKNTATVQTSPNDPWKGNPNASIAIIEFADLECGYCKRMSSEISKVYEAYKDDIIVIFKHYPLDPACNAGVKNKKHGSACFAAMAAGCAQEQHKFWAFHDITFKNQHAIAPTDLRLYAEKIGMNIAGYDACIQSRRTVTKIQEDTTLGASLDIHGTPRIWINNKLYRLGNSAQQMALFIEQTKGATPQDAAKNSASLRNQTTAISSIPDDITSEKHITYGDLQFSMHTFEAGIEDGKAISGKHVIPATRMSWFAAQDACEKAGMRLCTEQEWLSVCQGALAVDDDGDREFSDDLVEGTQYPYDDFHNPTLCWSAKEKETFRPVYTGEMPGCVSKDTIYDLVGNVEEWVGNTPETARLMGGAYDTPDDKARCYRANDTFGAGYSSKRTGFRCCT